jgi:hypothetical protein
MGCQETHFVSNAGGCVHFRVVGSMENAFRLRSAFRDSSAEGGVEAHQLLRARMQTTIPWLQRLCLQLDMHVTIHATSEDPSTGVCWARELPWLIYMVMANHASIFYGKV